MYVTVRVSACGTVLGDFLESLLLLNFTAAPMATATHARAISMRSHLGSPVPERIGGGAADSGGVVGVLGAPKAPVLSWSASPPVEVEHRLTKRVHEPDSPAWVGNGERHDEFPRIRPDRMAQTRNGPRPKPGAGGGRLSAETTMER